ncbi:unnamed protein product [Bursaphelenchus xylophilus]|uniref:(pine wood nematode) hypothetical protein n=1 Tax=Bursaphelenchus xylophilus TaxID=6326 RepID=A0A1I7RTP8_BURXY|nr:unnamed protein product [Bursaphelenchus xylophilus]CAG9122234.1 unnamed protein product [Bursaphelenchus xylophilus]
MAEKPKKIKDIKGYSSIAQLQQEVGEEQKPKDDQERRSGRRRNSKAKSDEKLKKRDYTKEYVFPNFQASMLDPPPLYPNSSGSSSSSFVDNNAYQRADLTNVRVPSPPKHSSKKNKPSPKAPVCPVSPFPSRVGSLASTESAKSSGNGRGINLKECCKKEEEDPASVSSAKSRSSSKIKFNWDDERVSLVALAGATVPHWYGRKDKSSQRENEKSEMSKPSVQDSVCSVGSIRDSKDLDRALMKGLKAKRAKQKQAEDSQKSEKRKSLIETEFRNSEPPLSEQEQFVVKEAERRYRKARHALRRLEKNVQISQAMVVEAQRYEEKTRDDLEAIKKTLKFRRSHKVDPKDDQRLERYLKKYRQIQQKMRGKRNASVRKSEGESTDQSDLKLENDLGKGKEKERKRSRSNDTSFGPFDDRSFQMSFKSEKSSKKSRNSRSLTGFYSSTNRSQSRQKSGKKKQKKPSEWKRPSKNTSSKTSTIVSSRGGLAKYFKSGSSVQSSGEKPRRRRDGLLDCTCPYRKLFNEVFIGYRTVKQIAEDVRPSEVKLFYRLPSRIKDMTNKAQLHMAYRSLPEEDGKSDLFAFPIVKVLSKDQAFYHVEHGQDHPRTFPDLISLMRHYSIYSYMNYEDNRVETFPVWEKSMEKFKV